MITTRHQVSRRNCAFLVALLGLCVSCGQMLPKPNRHLKEQATEAQILGQWSLTSNSLALLRRDGVVIPAKNNYGFTLQSNSVLRFESIYGHPSDYKWFDVPGTWKLGHGDGSSRNPKNELALRLNVEGKDWVFVLNFAREKGQLVLWNYHSDPDDGADYLEYVQSSVYP